MNREHRQNQIEAMFRRQGGKCHVCGEPAVLDGAGGKTNSQESAVRFRLGSSFGAKGRVRPRVMAHRKCADQRSREIELSLPVEEAWLRSGREPQEYYQLPGQGTTDEQPETEL